MKSETVQSRSADSQSAVSQVFNLPAPRPARALPLLFRPAAPICAAVALSLCAATSARGLQQAADGDAAGTQEAVSQAQAQAVKAQSEAERELEKARLDLEKATQQLFKSASNTNAYEREKARQEHEKAVDEFFQKSTGSAGFSAGGSPHFTQRLQNIVPRFPGQTGKPLIIRSSEFDPQEQAKLEEDLAVMSHLLDKTVDEQVGGLTRTRSAMGIDLVFAPVASPLRSFYLEGYGALFMLRVNFPLLPPPKKTEAQKEKPATDSAWEEARRELYGHPAPAGPAAEYSEEKVNQLKQALLEALKDAANIRGLTPEEWVTVCVWGGAGPTAFRHTVNLRRAPRPGTPAPPTAPPAPPKPSEPPRPGIDSGAGPNEVSVLESGSAPVRQTVLTLRVKKADAEAFAQGKVSLDEFRKQVRILIYPGSPENGGGFGSGGGLSGGGF